MKYLYKLHSGSLGSWRIWAEGNILHIAHATVIGGSEVRHTEKVELNKSGRTLDEQIALRINSRISRMKDRGYQETREEALKFQGNQLGLENCMLAHPIERVNNVNYRGAVLQKKLDGHRCLITCRDGELIAYSRKGKRIDAITHILRGLAGRIPEGTTVDGELYCHGYKLQTLGSWIKREQPDTYKLYFVAYDLLSRDSYRDRHAELSQLLAGVDTGAAGQVVVLPYREYTNPEDMLEWFREVRRDGFEGLMLRLDGRGYEAGKRSSGLLKIKEFHDQEFEVVGVTASEAGWAVCHCKAPNGRIFKCSAPGNFDEKFYVINHIEEFVGKKLLTVEFAHWTDDGIPFQPTATRWRDDI